MNNHALVMAGTAGAIVLGSISPWVRYGQLIQIDGTTGDGQITLVLGIIVGICAVAALSAARPREMLIAAGACAVVAGGIAGNAWLNVADMAAAESAIAPGWGVQIVTIAAIPGLIVLIDSLRNKVGSQAGHVLTSPPAELPPPRNPG